MAKPSPEEMTELADKIRGAAMVICGNCAVAALALIQAATKQEAHVLADHIPNEGARELFASDVARMKAAATRALEKAGASRDFKTNSAGGS